MDIDAAIREVQKDMGVPGYRAAYGQHVPFAWIVRGLVEQGYGVSESVRKVVEKAGLTPVDRSVRSLRATYYKVRTREWPANMAKIASNYDMPVIAGQTTGDEEEDFEV